MIPTDITDFTEGYADAEEDMLEDGFDYLPLFNYFKHCKSLDHYEQGYFLRLQEEDERVNK